MRILITNDDGINAEGIHALAEVFGKNHEITVIAPSSERSACSHSLSSMYSVTYSKDERFGYNAYACSGTPADCVKLGILHILKQAPDLVLSGINNGCNLGSDVIYSGTVSAAFEGVYMGIPSIAVSTDYRVAKPKLLEIAQYVSDNLDRFIALKIPKGSAININYPSTVPLKGGKITKLGIHLYGDGFFPASDGGLQLQGQPLPLKEDSLDCDIHWFKEGYVTVTPVQNDRNDYATLNRIKGDF